MRASLSRLCVTLLMAACSTPEPAQRSKPQQAAGEGDGSVTVTAAPEGALKDNNTQWANREVAATALLDCARLTFASNEAPLLATLYTDEPGRVLALEVTDGNGTPQALMCPMDRARVGDVLAGAGGRSWGRPPNGYGWRMEVYCASSFDGVTGCGLQRIPITSSTPPPERVKAPPADPPAKQPATVEQAVALAAKNVSRLEHVERGEELREYRLRRLGTDVLSKEVVNLEQQLSQVDLAVNLCLHARQPNLPLHTSTDFVLRMEVSRGGRAMVAPFSISGGYPDALFAFLRPCINAMVGEEAAQGLSALVRYSAVASKTQTPPGRFVQQVDVEVLTDNVEVGAPSSVRRELTSRVAAALKLCMEKHPVESRAVLGRWSQVGAVRISGEVETRRQDRLHLQHLEARDATNDRDIKPIPAVVERQVRCAFEDLPMDGQGTAAKVDWVFILKAATLPR